jgi:mRNA interferase MazF
MTTKFTQVNNIEILLKQTMFPFLKKDSLLKLNKIATIDLKFSAGKIGELDEETIKRIDKNLIALFQIQI